MDVYCLAVRYPQREPNPIPFRHTQRHGIPKPHRDPKRDFDFISQLEPNMESNPKLYGHK